LKKKNNNNNLVALTAMELNFDEFKSGGLHKRHAVATWTLGNNLNICLKTEENQENQDVEIADRKTFWMHTDCLERKVHLYGT
jgi:hypothetical protein